MSTPLNQIINPTNEQRHEMLRHSLEEQKRTEDYEYIVNLLSPPLDITNYASPGELSGVNIGIIGGGLAGLSAAFELRKLGANITIFDSNIDRVGGRVYTYYFDSEGKYYNEFGAHRIPVSHETTWHYINLFGLYTHPLSVALRNNFIYVHNTRLRTSSSIEQLLYPLFPMTPRERNTSWDDLNHYAFMHLMKSLPPNIRSEIIQILPYYSAEYLPFIEYSVRQTLENLGLSQGAISLISSVEPGIGALLNVSYNEVINEEYSVDYRNIYTIEGGVVNLPYAFIQSFLLDNPPQYTNVTASQLGRVTYNAGKIVTGIYNSKNINKVTLEYQDVTNSENATDIFDYVICAVPFSTLREIKIIPYFSNLKMQAISELNYVDSQKTFFLCNERFWEYETSYGGIAAGFSRTDLPIQYIFYPRDYTICPDVPACSPGSPGVLIASYNFNLNATRVGNMEGIHRFNYIRESVEEVHGLLNGYLNHIVEAHKTVIWNNEPNFRGAFAQNLPGQKKLFAYEMSKPEFDNRLYFAGEHISAKHAWMQGSLYTGKNAANQLAQHFHDNFNNTV
jgi:monoamine oxidase